ncbi:hypothetical protein [Mycolicibacterium arenosum]|uniref:hypothetical protein n=1 Tax=Mycolicibacterium arenosum TaxID=2952157 RepID=UPI0038CD8A84
MATVRVRYDPFDAEILDDPYPTYPLLRDLPGVSTADRDRFRMWSSELVQVDVTHGQTTDALAAVASIYAYFTEFLADRRKTPRENLMSALANATVDGVGPDGEVLGFCAPLLARTLTRQCQETHSPGDRAGLLWFAADIALIAVTEAPVRCWTDLWGLAFVAVGGIGTTVFVLVELRHEHAIVHLLLIAVGLYLVSRLGVEATYPDFLGPLLAMGAGLGLITAPATTAIVAATPVEKHGVAAAVNDASREIGAAVGVAIAGSVLAAGYTNRIEPVLPTVASAAREPISDSLAAALQVAQQAGPSAQQVADIARAAFVHGNSQAALALSAITAISALVLGVWAPGRPPATTRRRPNVTGDGRQLDPSTESSAR